MNKPTTFNLGAFSRSPKSTQGAHHAERLPCILLVGTTIAFILPAVYRSTATILIEEQEIPSGFGTFCHYHHMPTSVLKRSSSRS